MNSDQSFCLTFLLICVVIFSDRMSLFRKPKFKRLGDPIFTIEQARKKEGSGNTEKPRKKTEVPGPEFAE
jgi:hypothetical protein